MIIINESHCKLYDLSVNCLCLNQDTLITEDRDINQHGNTLKVGADTEKKIADPTVPAVRTLFYQGINI